MTNYDILKEYEAHNTPVPSFEEWQQLRKFLEEFNALEVAKKNQQLRELLEECFGWFTWYQIDVTTGRPYIEAWQKKGRDLRAKIDNAIGEK